MKLRVKRPFWTFFWCFPLIAALLHDIIIFIWSGNRFYFSEVGYLFDHYVPQDAHARILGFIDQHRFDSPIFFNVLKILLNSKAVIVGAIYALPGLFWINRKKHGDRGPVARRLRR